MTYLMNFGRKTILVMAVAAIILACSDKHQDRDKNSTIRKKAAARTLQYLDLSDKNNYIVTVEKDSSASEPSLKTITTTISQKNKPAQRQIITIPVDRRFWLPSDVFTNKNHTRSYMTGKNINTEVNDNDYGDLVVADFNFDGKEDFCVKINYYADAGPIYLFYVQSQAGIFDLDPFLSNYGFFPEIDPASKTIKILTYQPRPLNEKTYQHENGRWKIVSSKPINQ